MVPGRKAVRAGRVVAGASGTGSTAGGRAGTIVRRVVGETDAALVAGRVGR